MSRVQKMELYDKFQCIAGQCGFTCCTGWDITVDADTYDKWKDHGQAGDFINHLKMKNQNNVPDYSMKLGPEKQCPFLDEQGLCNIVSAYGEEYLPDTCRTFPRLENRFGELRELSLSCACPVVVTMIDQVAGYLSLLPAAKEDIASMPIGYQLRNALLTIMQERTYSFKDRILLGFQLLMDIKDEAGMVDRPQMNQRKEAMQEAIPQLIADAELIEECTLKYKDPEYQKSLIDLWSGVEVEQTDSWLEVNELFLDICKNYRKEIRYQDYLQGIYEFAEILDTEEDTEPLERFRSVFGEFDRLMENCFAAKLFAGCVNDDIDGMLLSYQMLVTEYVMIRYASFLRFLMHDKKAKGNGISSDSVRDDIVCFSRIIGYNTDGMREFWEDSFDDAIWELGYLILLVS